MITKITSGTVQGVSGCIITVEVDLSPGLPGFDIVGLPDSGIKESKERVRTAIKNSGQLFPIKRITVNLAPADIKKEGPSFDLPIAVGIMACMGIIDPEHTEGIFFAGELSLDGKLRPVSGILPMVHKAYKENITTCIVPYENAEEAALIEDMRVFAVKDLSDLVRHFNEYANSPITVDTSAMYSRCLSMNIDFSDVRGQENVKRALEVAAAGAHNALMIGSPGSGKTMLAKRFPTILPPLAFEESIDVTKIYSVAGLLPNKNSLVVNRPFRSPHHTISYSALTGGGRIPKPGEISLAHNGILFLDELPEFHRNVLEVLRQPLEDGYITVSRVNSQITYPADFTMIASMNPCPCGHLGDADKCHCTLGEIAKYQGKISGPLLDRIDIQAESSPVDYESLSNTAKPESSKAILERVNAARAIQKERYKGEGIMYNSRLNAAQIQKYCGLGSDESKMLKQAFERLNLSARAYHKILKVARTIADLEGSEHISLTSLTEAIGYRSLDRKYWGA